MSYCRFSSDDGKSDVYVYASGGAGYVTSVAHSRINPNVKEGAARYIVIDLPHAGEQFCDTKRSEVFDRLLSLRELGYHVPEAALDRLRREMSSENKA